MTDYDLIIIGGGAAGLAAAVYSARYTLKTLILCSELGGTGLEAHKVDNWLGEPGITGTNLMNKFTEHVKSYNVPIIEENVISISKDNNVFQVKTHNKSFTSKAAILATGMKHRHLNVPGESEFAGKGVSYCYTCDAAFYPGKVVGVVGGGDSAALGAILLSKYAKKVIMFVRSKLRAEPISVKQIENTPNITIHYGQEIKEITGDKSGVTGVTLKDESSFEMDGIFIEAGLLPVNDLAKSLGVEVDSNGFIQVTNEMQTNVEGVFAAGDITNATSLRQFITSASAGSIAAQSAYEFVKKLL